MGFNEGHDAFTHFTVILKLLVDTLFDKNVYVCVCVFSVCLVLIFITWETACPSSGRVSGVRFWWAVDIRRWGGSSPRLCHTILAKWHTDTGNPVRFYGLHSHVFHYYSYYSSHYSPWKMIKQMAQAYNFRESFLLCEH